ncbi:MAG: T9SS type A sorting domain-containing protein [Ignavibacteriaceae bacterium]|nr:T9SS type A sorting domain-containing protein [Ignavibacteriaceae bacterium]
MRILITLLVLLTTQLFSQTYLNIAYTNGNQANSTNLASISKITFVAGGINFTLNDNSIISKDLSIISRMTFGGTDGGNPLPVELISFTSVINGTNIVLVWNTAVEINNYGFDIERNEAQNGWEKIGFVKGNGNSTNIQKFSFIDSPHGTGNISYRLKQIDFSGKFKYSNVINMEITHDLSQPVEYKLSQNYPNPFNPSTRITYSLPNDGFVSLRVFNVLGKEVASLVNENKKAGNYEIMFDGSKLASGVYIGKMISANYTSSIKMIIMK